MGNKIKKKKILARQFPWEFPSEASINAEEQLPAVVALSLDSLI